MKYTNNITSTMAQQLIGSKIIEDNSCTGKERQSCHDLHF